MAIESRAPLMMATSSVPALVRSKRRGFVTPGSVAAVALVALSSSALAPLSVACLIVSAAVLGLVAAKTGTAPLLRALADSAARRQRETRRDARQRTLGPASRESLSDLTGLVDDIERLHPDVAELLDLETLLDRYAALTSAHERATRAVRMVDRVQLERMRDAYRADSEANPKRLELCERRLQCHAHCEAKAEELADEIAIVADFIRLVAQRAACPDDPLPDDSLDRQLAELEADEAARRQLAGESE